ncbi:MAG: hypothetical protein LBF95_10825 [Treponema sp.]|jgi:hypothetical protein|nr:hypothetical protein [Treponema sp.]
MKKLAGICTAALLLATGCASLVDSFTGETAAIDESTTIINPSGAWSYAARLDQQARIDADNKATRQRQVTQQQTVTEWKHVGYDYDFNAGELKVGIAEGKYKLGEAQYRGSTTVISGPDGSAVITGGDPYVYPVYLKTTRTENVTKTITETDEKLWQKTYAESLQRRQDYIDSKFLAEGTPAGENASPMRQKIMARLEKRLRENLLPGTWLVYGGWSGDKYEQENLLIAYLEDDGSFYCEWCK